MSGIYKDGIATRRKVPMDKYTKADFIRRDAYNLRRESVDCGWVLNALMHAGKVPPKLIYPVSEFYVGLLDITEPSRFSEARISKALQAEIRAFSNTIDQLEMALLELTISGARYKKTKDQIVQVCEACRHFMRQVELTMASFKPGVRLPFPPTDWLVKYVVEGMFTGYREHVRDVKFPPYKRLAKILDSGGLSLSEKMYRKYKQQYDAQTYYDLIH